MRNAEHLRVPATPVTGVLLAAGAGTRLGLGPKALLPYRGRPLVESVGNALLEGGCREVVVVLGAGASEVQAAASLDRFRVVDNADWQTGMGSSFLLGNHAADPGSHLLIALVDQPGLTPETVRRLLAAHRPGRVTAAAYRRAPSDGGLPDTRSHEGDAGRGDCVEPKETAGGNENTEQQHRSRQPGFAPHGDNRGQARQLQRGHPLLIDASLREAVCATVTGDAGARGFLRSHPDLVDEVDCSDQSTGEDVDTPDQLGLLQ
ncbi:nucleotidyltransferase family protein [Arthrobacter sp. FW306-05-C]|uniref:nucleotidyltransferase family protein n=1 Tax=Arthrobacter sp. FW306-05-C TaxID=2879620 RepID=UPI001F31DAB1|nr:nucleotidyltransferase family protein [Arthrobacter sp. FW306-05-C]UKA66196.1 nucleotidyltransferase family protein [Arthrobacter sp. FW306-05-C]